MTAGFGMNWPEPRPLTIPITSCEDESRRDENVQLRTVCDAFPRHSNLSAEGFWGQAEPEPRPEQHKETLNFIFEAVPTANISLLFMYHLLTAVWCDLRMIKLTSASVGRRHAMACKQHDGT